ncbi:hypothetical protein CcrKarma_gp050 [Caulobacter virus Karma]|uniref:hypothetical protein n=1 Tax=Caulobacter virus Karma TaxID=1211641 RepID=UPI00028B6CAB|nr:hypothetical protein CcrKarma_gp050 [Caulobacter virus Karma]AFU87567.1 hypothetical protein CcrKarma_gp050 [Caulobacter virus Karma]
MSTALDAVLARIESGEPFTYAGLSAVNDAAGGNEARDRLADRTIQKYRRKGWITFTREGRYVVWRPTPAGAAQFNLQA